MKQHQLMYSTFKNYYFDLDLITSNLMVNKFYRNFIVLYLNFCDASCRL